MLLVPTSNLSLNSPWLAGRRRAAGSVSVSVEPVFWRKLGLYFLTLSCASQELEKRSKAAVGTHGKAHLTQITLGMER